MRRIFFALVLTATLASLCTQAHAQATTARASVPLPASDAVVFVDMKRLLTEAMPRALASDAQRAAQVNADIEQFKTRTGIDARTLDTLTVGARILKLPSGATKFDNVVAVGRGTFSTDAIVAAGRAAAAGTFTQETYGGKTIYVFAVNDRMKVFGLAKMHVSRLAVVALDATTLAVGDPEAVRSAIDAAAEMQAGKKPISKKGLIDAIKISGLSTKELVQQIERRGVDFEITAADESDLRAAGARPEVIEAARGRGRGDQLLASLINTTDIIAFAGNVPTGTFAGVDMGNPDFERIAASIRGFRGSVGTTPTGYQMTTILRTQNAADARQLYQTVDALKLFAPGLIMAAGERWRFALGLVNSMKLSTSGNEVTMRLDIPQSDIVNILRAL